MIAIRGEEANLEREVETPTYDLLSQATKDELFVTQEAAVNGITIVNESENENLVMLKHFGPKP